MNPTGKSTRRSFLATIAGGAATAALGGRAFAQDPIQALLQNPQRGQWSDQFDAGRGEHQPGTSNLPILSSRTPQLIEAAMGDYRRIVANGGWPVVPANEKLELGVASPSIPILRKRLIISGDLPSASGESQTFDSWVDGAVRRFQLRHGLPADGVIGKYTYAAMNVSASVRLGQLETNLVRLRAMSGYLGDRYVMVNIPAAQIEAVELGQVVQRHTAVVGKIDRQTPVLNSNIHEIIFNPYWTAPKSIIQKDIIPVMRKEPDYLVRNNIHIFDSSGNEIAPETIDWSTNDAAEYMFRQDPGKINAMASVKINFHNPHAVYMHDTPQQGLFGRIERFHSSGCVRVQNVRDLVAWILKDSPGWQRQQIEQVVATGANTSVPVENPVPVYFTYVTAWSVQPGVVEFRDDIYHRDGVEALALDSTAL